MRTSYGYKHIVEKFFGYYMSNDAFKQVAKELGIKSQPEHYGSPNEFYALSDKISPITYRDFNIEEVLTLKEQEKI
ncbi:MAG: hypothetical protein LUD76_00485 [Alistipes sp.]|nr:hypothetical protein [Alistipes sp.]